MDFTRMQSFSKQIALHLKSGNFGRAYEVSVEFVQKFPDEMLAHFLLAESAYRLGRFEEAKTAGRKAFNMSSQVDDMIGCALITSSAYFSLKDYAKGYELLKEMERRKDTEELQTALVVFSIALDKPDEALEHVQKLFEINQRLAADMAMRVLGF